MKSNNRIDDLQIGGLKIKQNPEWFCFGIDSVLLADFAKEIKNGDDVIDLGCGNGILELLLSQKSQAKKIVGIEVQKEISNLAIENVKQNQLEEKIEIIHENIKNLKHIFQPDTFDAVISNPPYLKEKSRKIK